MPPLGMLLGGIDFSDFFFVLKGPHAETLDMAKESGGGHPELRPVPQRHHSASSSWRSRSSCWFAGSIGCSGRRRRRRRRRRLRPKSEILLEEIRDLLRREAPPPRPLGFRRGGYVEDGGNCRARRNCPTDRRGSSGPESRFPEKIGFIFEAAFHLQARGRESAACSNRACPSS